MAETLMLRIPDVARRTGLSVRTLRNLSSSQRRGISGRFPVSSCVTPGIPGRSGVWSFQDFRFLGRSCGACYPGAIRD